MKDKLSENKIGVLVIVGVILGLGYTIYTKANNIITVNNIYAVIGFFITLTPICIALFLYSTNIKVTKRRLSIVIKIIVIFIYVLYLVTSVSVLAFGASDNLYIKFGV